MVRQEDVIENFAVQKSNLECVHQILRTLLFSILLGSEHPACS